MGVDSKKPPPLPAPTETETTTPTELTSTELSKPGDEKSSYSIPDDGTPVTIRTRGHRANKSQTSLLIEYFEGGKSSASGTGSTSERRPSVRVRLTPSRKGKGDHIQVTESKGSRKASVTRRIPLEPGLREIDLQDEGEDANSMTSYASATEESTVSRNPIDIEIDRSHRRRRPASPLIPSETYQPANASEISAIPADSFLDGSGPSTDLKRSSSPSRGEALAAAAGAGAAAGAVAGSISSSKTRQRERVKTAEKAKEKPERKRRSKSRATSVTEHTADDLRSPRHRSSRGYQESGVSVPDSTVLSSNVSGSHHSSDAHSMRSGASKSSINNPKLLETVEDAIRRLILPELSALKREQSKRESRRGSLSLTETSVSKEDLTLDRRRSSGQRTDVSRDGSKKERRNREARHDYGDSSPLSVSRESIHDDYLEHGDAPATPKRSDLLKAAAAGAALSKGISALDDKTQSEDRRQRDRRRRRTDTARSRSLGRDRYAEEYDDDEWAPAPPMPLMSDINPSEMTRTSILSAETDRPHSASEEMVHEVPHGVAAAEARGETPDGLQRTLGTSHANVSHGDLTALPRGNKNATEPTEEYEIDEYGRKVPIDYRDDDYADDDPRDHSDPGDYPDRSFEEEYYSTQDVPPPLKYVPYQAGARGLSPIPSVSGYTEGGSEAQHPRHSRSMNSIGSDAYPSPEKTLDRGAFEGSAHSLNSVPSNMRSREFDQYSADGQSARSAGADYRNTVYTEDSELGQSQAGREVRGVGANPNIIHPPMGVESAVASLVDGSMLEQSVLTSGSGYDYNAPHESNISYDRRTQSSRGDSPLKYAESSRDIEDERQPTPGSRSQDRSQDFSEYEIDEHGRKVPRTKYRNSPTASEAAITAGAVGAAAAALKAAQERRQAITQDNGAFVPAGVGRNKSFKERTMDSGYEPRNTPAHSIDRFSYEESKHDEPKFSASYMPGHDDDPMPEIGYMDDDAKTNPSVVEERLDGVNRGVHPGQEDWSGRATPTPGDVNPDHHDGTTTPKGERGLGITEAAAAAAIGAAAGMAATHSREPSHDQDDWQRTSAERKRDTLLTNPYEDASPIVNPALNDNLLHSRALDNSYNAPYHTGSPGYPQKFDEGYMSNRSGDVDIKGKGVDFSSANQIPGDDPFYVPNVDTRQLSGMSQGVASPFYDAATGAGIDRIENKDIVALMQHLMVRDAQRSARDTEIVALLMNAALEMRNSFREMKELIQDTGDDVIFSNSENTEKLQKAINGPRPFPGTAARSIQSASQPGTIDDAAAKKKNLWKRALAGLSAKGTNDLSRIEDMLMQLLGEVDVLKTQTAPLPSSGAGQSSENLQPEGQYEQDRGYEPEGISTVSHPSPSGQMAVPQNRAQSTRSANETRLSDHRVSTVQEHEDEYEYDHPSPAAERMDPGYLSASHQEPTQRGISVPPESPLQHASPSQQQALSADNTPRTERGKKHKSSSSSGWLPKISRWSESTATSVGRALRGNGKKDSKYDDTQLPSRSGSSLASYDQEYEHDPYGQDKLHSGFSDPNLGTAQPPVDAPAGSQAAYISPEDPKYKAHRNSINLQHPQPRPGQTERFRNALEYSAQEYNDPSTPKSADWAGSATSLHRLPQNSHRYSGSSAEPWTSPSGGQSGPPRPPKEPIDSQHQGVTPSRARISKLAKNSPLQNESYESGYGYTSPTGSPKPENRNLNAALGVPTRRPSGPRAMTPKSPEEEAAREERRRKRGMFS